MIASDRVGVAVAALRAALAGYVFRARNEAELQDQVCEVLISIPDVTYAREAKVNAGRIDVLIKSHFYDGNARTTATKTTVTTALELKLKASAASVERQAQRYALMPDVDAVVVVTTSRRLAAQLVAAGDVGQPPLPTLGGKPFHVIPLRTS